MTVFVILPAYNEEESISPLFKRLKDCEEKSEFKLIVVVVNDGSKDQTSAVALEEARDLNLSLHLIEHEHNKGLGQAIKTGMMAFLSMAGEQDCLVTMDCDNTQPPELLEKMYFLISQQGYDLVIASRYQPGSEVVGLSKFRLLMSYGSSFLMQWLLPTPGVKDYTCGFRAYSYILMKRLIDTYQERLFTEDGFACMVDILLKARRLKPRVKEVAMVLRYDQKPGVSKMKVAKTIRQTLALILKHKFN
jgi:dolichol-phosphate mannosyltransferase